MEALSLITYQELRTVTAEPRTIEACCFDEAPSFEYEWPSKEAEVEAREIKQVEKAYGRLLQ